ncbi:hypothetical protein NUU61_006520, partial [Penicillium alfredii]
SLAHPHPPSDDDDPTSSSGSSSSESESDSDSDSDQDDDIHHADHGDPSSAPSIPHIPGRPKPRIRRIKQDSGLLSRLSTFLPKMKDANESLQREIEAGRAGDVVMDSVGKEGETEDEDEDENENDGKQYIEMNLGLGVLEEKRDNEDGSSSGNDGGGADSTQKPGSKQEEGNLSKAQNDSDVLGKLMGDTQSAADKPSIEEIAE